MSKPQNKTGELTANQHRAILALLSASSIREAAIEAKISEPTMFRWLKDKAFSNAYMQARREATPQALAQLQQAGSEAVETLRDLMKDKTATSGARVSAAKAVLELSIKAVELQDLAECVEELESRVEAQNGKKGGR